MTSAPDSKLPLAADKLLGEWPLPARDWDAMAESIMARTQLATAAGADDVLQAPLPAEPGEDGYESKKQAIAHAAPMNLAALARASMKKKTDGDKGIALESLAVASQARAHVGEIAQRLQAAARTSAPDASEVQPGPAEVAAAAAMVEAAPQNQEPPRVAPPAPLPAAARGNVSRGPWVLSGIAVAAAAAALVLSLRKSEAPAPLVETRLPQATQQATTKSPAVEAKAEDAPLPPAQLPAAERATSVPGAAAAPKSASGGAAAPMAPSAGPSAVKPEQIVLEDEEAQPKPVAVPAAAPTTSGTMRPAELPTGGLPDKPSTGAVNAAIGSVMGSARACVAGHDEPSTARIVFGSDGSVQSVNVTGAAAGTPAAACIQGALKRARVQPFAAPSFTISTTVRPN